MRKKLLVAFSISLIFFIWVVNALANTFFWYSALPWFDNMMHFFGGIWLGLIITLALSHYKLFKKYQGTSREMLVSFLLMIVVAIYWEVFEFGVQNIIQFVHLADIPDSISDLIFDTLGWFVGYRIVRMVIMSQSEKNTV